MKENFLFQVNPDGLDDVKDLRQAVRLGQEFTKVNWFCFYE